MARSQAHRIPRARPESRARSRVRYAEKGRAMVGLLVDSIDKDERVIQVNEPFAVTLISSSGASLEAPIVGEFDLIVEKEQQLLIVDLKTAARKWAKNQAEKSLQATVYGYA